MQAQPSYIDGEFLYAEPSALLNVCDPASGELIGQACLATHSQVTIAVEAAARAQRAWSRLAAIERARYLHDLADVLQAEAPSIGEVLARESGKSVGDAISEVRYAAEITRYHAEWARRIEGEVIPSDNSDETIILQREPIGVVACLIPFNFPIYTLMRKVAPALLTGNAVVVRPSNHTPLSAMALARALAKVGLPRGLVNIMAMENDVAATMCTHAAVSMITLTGSVQAGQAVLEYCKANIAKPSLELGGKTPAIIAPDADLRAAAAAVVASKTSHAGQLCTAISRVYVHESIHDEFLSLLREGFRTVMVGNRADNPDCMGPLVSAGARDAIHAMVERALKEGAMLESGGVMPSGPGHFYPATLLSHCRNDMEIVREEIFGPVLAVLRYQSLDEAIALANDHQYGLSSVLYTEDFRTAMSVAGCIEAGELYINRPPADPYQGFHAGWKRSGIGGDDGKHGMLEFTQTRLVVMKH